MSFINRFLYLDRVRNRLAIDWDTVTYQYFVKIARVPRKGMAREQNYTVIANLGGNQYKLKGPSGEEKVVNSTTALSTGSTVQTSSTSAIVGGAPRVPRICFT
jgi:hypothetical protein